MKAIILAAGIGSRLGKPHPKPLTLLDNGRSIMHNQIKALQRYMDIDDIFVVVGFKKELIMEAFPELTYVYNDYFDTTNTSKSLLKAMKKLRGQDIIWMNGDVVFEHQVLKRIIEHDGSCMAVNQGVVGEEEVKYTLDKQGFIQEVSKSVRDALGEAVGINKVVKEDLPLLIDMLEHCQNDDYFERGIELAISHGLQISPVDISDLLCTEIDFEEDLKRVNTVLSTRKS